MNQARINNLTTALAANNLDAALFLPGTSLVYFTGLNFHLMERPIVAFFTPNYKPALVAPGFECAILDTPEDWQLYPWDDESGPNSALQACLQDLKLNGKKLGVEPLSFRYHELSLLKQFAPQATLKPVDHVVTPLRMVKDATEIEAMRRAAALVDGVLETTVPRIKIGMTEKDLAAELMVGLLRAGSGSLPFAPLVQTGLTGAAPHAHAGDRVLAPGDLLIIDYGARDAGYASDITRTFAVGELNAEARKIYNLVKAANQAGRHAVQPGITCQAVDAATRQVIDNAGYGQYFNHRTGHGLGLDGHEPPFIVAGDTTVLQPGFTFTVEPGIYIAGLGGVRIEDDVVVTTDGVESLTTFSRELVQVG